EGVVELASAPAIVPTTYAVTPVSATIAASEEGAADGQEPASAQAESGDNRESQNSGQPGSAGASSAPASDAQATPANANADDQAARSGLEEADDMQDQPLDTKAPLSDSLPFLATLGALCSSSIPILRRCK
ncbi:MAG: hypothetical protein IJH04_01790, partial [Eggerthellaceae bacterium]|nr:hypothetical protein [Eggerthellaceae bacterium]